MCEGHKPVNPWVLYKHRGFPAKKPGSKAISVVVLTSRRVKKKKNDQFDRLLVIPLA